LRDELTGETTETEIEPTELEKEKKQKTKNELINLLATQYYDYNENEEMS